MRLDITELSVECFADGTSKVSLWVKCYSPEAVDDVVEWLKAATALIESWEAIRKPVP